MAQQTSAYEKLKDYYASLGLASLAPKILDFLQKGMKDDELYVELRKTTEYQTRFAAITERKKKFPELSQLTEAEVLSAEKAIEEEMHFFGLPKGFYDDPSDYAKLIGANVGRGELRNRLNARKAVVMDGKNTGVLAYAKEKYGLSDGDLIAYFIDPERAAPLLEKIAAASQIGAAGARTGFGAVAKADAERLAALGISGDQAAAGYSQAAELGGLAEEIQGTDSGQITRKDLARATLEDDADARKRIARRQEERKARFSGGGSYSESQGGVTGLGSANRR